jgi:hypothetical protein
VQGFEPQSFRSRGAMSLAAGAVVVLALTGVTVGLSHPIGSVLPLLVVLGLLAVVLVLVLWRPRLDLTQDGVRVVNPLRTRFVPWSSIRSVDNRFTMVLHTDDGPIPVWAVPRPSPGSNVVAIRRDAYGLPDYRAQEQFARQDQPHAYASAAQRVIEARLRHESTER